MSIHVRRFLGVLFPLGCIAAAAAVWLSLCPANAQGSDVQGVLITEICAKNLTGITAADGSRCDWIELTNTTDADVDLGGWQISDKKSEPGKYVFPAGTTLAAHSCLVLFADGAGCVDAEGALHLNFLLNADGETLYLTDPAGEAADVFAYPQQDWDITFGRSGADNASMGYFASPTPGSANPSVFLQRWQGGDAEQQVYFSREAGMYAEGFALALSTDDPDTIILYTTDGSDPASGGSIYTGELEIRDRSGEPNRYLTEPSDNSVSPLWVSYGDTEMPKCTTVKARVYKDGQYGSLYTASYWVAAPAHTLPVVSVSADEDELFGNDGIYTLGTAYYTAQKYGMESTYPIGNDLSGKEISATVEVFGTDGSRTLADTAQIHIAGEGSRAYSVQKSIGVSLDGSAYTINIDGSEYELEEFTLRGAGCGESYYASYQDAFLSNYLDEYSAVDLGAQYNQPVILYLEGEYWGIYMLREKKGAELYARHYGVDESRIVRIGGSGDEPGTEDEVEALLQRVEALDCNDPDDLAWVEQTFDMENIIAFMICSLYTNNYDGAMQPNHNVILWRTDYTDSANPYADGRWRALINDLDVTLTDPESRAVPAENFVSLLVQDGTDYHASQLLPRRLVQKLLGNAEFRQRFINACAESLQTTYSAEGVTAALQTWRALLEPEQTLNLARREVNESELAGLYRRLYDDEVPTLSVDLQGWRDIMDGMERYTASRTANFEADLWTYFPDEMAAAYAGSAQ